MSAQRLPHPGGDNGDWGDILNGFLEVSHNGDGTLIPQAVIDAGAITTANIVSANTIRPTSGAPTSEPQDQAGDFAYDSTANVMYGPFVGTGTSGTWPAGVSLGGGGGFNAFSVVSSGTTTMVADTLYITNGSDQFNLPSTISAEQMFGVVRGNNTATLTITAAAGQTINGGSAGGSITIPATVANNLGTVVLLAVSSTALWILSTANTDAGIGATYGGENVFNALTQFKGSVEFFGKFAFNITTKNTSSLPYTSLYSDNIIELTGSTTGQTLTLGNASFAAGQLQEVINASSVYVTLAASSGTTEITGLSAGARCTLRWDGTNWYAVGTHGLITSGTRLATQVYAPTSKATYSVTGTTLTAIDTINMTVSFTAPPSGNVEVSLTGSGYCPTAGNLYWALLDHTSGALRGTAMRVTSQTFIGTTVKTEITGLTPGMTYQIDWAIANDTSGDVANTYAQGQTSTTIAAAGAGPAVMAVTAL